MKTEQKLPSTADVSLVQMKLVWQFIFPFLFGKYSPCFLWHENSDLKYLIRGGGRWPFTEETQLVPNFNKEGNHYFCSRSGLPGNETWSKLQKRSTGKLQETSQQIQDPVCSSISLLDWTFCFLFTHQTGYLEMASLAQLLLVGKLC